MSNVTDKLQPSENTEWSLRVNGAYTARIIYRDNKQVAYFKYMKGVDFGVHKCDLSKFTELYEGIGKQPPKKVRKMTVSELIDHMMKNKWAVCYYVLPHVSELIIRYEINTNLLRKGEFKNFINELNDGHFSPYPKFIEGVSIKNEVVEV